MSLIYQDVPSSEYSLVGDFNFDGEHPVLTFEIPMRSLRALIAGPDSRTISISRKEVIALLHVIAKNPQTSAKDLEIIRGLLAKN